MARAFAQIAFTPNVQSAQTRMGSRTAYRSAELGAPEVVKLGSYETAFIEARDSFYQGTVGENGWPYVQHRGGPAGFLKVLGPRLIGYADFSGNRQYISVGNLEGDDRVSLFLMDYVGQQRLKIWGRARLIDEDAEPELFARLESPSYRAPVERGVVISVEAFDWNCPKHITPRFTEPEVKALFSAWQQGGSGEVAAAEMEELGSGSLRIAVTGIRQLTRRVRAYELRAQDGGDLPPFAAGAHLSVPVRLPNGSLVTRQYSLTGDPLRRDRYEIAVQREESGRGGSAAIHATWQLGTRLALELPVNQFPLHDDARPAVLIAGGIGITPIKAMAHALKARGNRFALHVVARTAGEMAFRDTLENDFPRELLCYFSREAGASRLDLPALMRGAEEDAVFYVCGPAGLTNAVKALAGELAIPAGRVQFESFE